MSDHGHSPVHAHDDLAVLFRETWGFRTLAHPWTVGTGHEVAVMVSGNAMAHLYLELDRRERPFWPTLRSRWAGVVEALLARESVDLLILPHGSDSAEIRAARRGAAMLRWHGDSYSYEPLDGDPLALGALHELSTHEAYDATMESEYPDALVQIAQLAAGARCGDVLLSAARGWDFRDRYEPIPHCSTHGALLRDHMLAPILLNHPLGAQGLSHPPRRTVDVMPSALAALGRPVPPGLDGETFATRPGSLALSSIQ